MSKDVLVLVKPWIADKKNIHSASFRAAKVRQTEKAVLLKLKDGREEWFPWSTVKNMEWAK